MKIYTVRDSKAEAYLQPFFAINDNIAMRMMLDTANDQTTLFYKHPEDFQIFVIGKFNEKTGEITSINHVSLGKVIDLLSYSNEN